MENEKTYDLNDKQVLKSFYKYKTKINNCFLNNEDIMCNRKIIAQEIFEYEYMSLSTKSSNTPGKCVNRIYLYNDGCKSWDNIENFQTVLSKFKELKKNNKIVNMCDTTLLLLNIFPNM